MHHTVTNSIYLIITLDSSILRINQRLENQFHTHCMFWDIFMYYFLLTVRQRKLQERIGQTNLFNTTRSNDRFISHVKQFVFD